MPPPPGHVRRVLADELDAWCACPRTTADADLEDWRQGERAWVERWHPTPSHLYVFDAGDDFLGKFDVPCRNPSRWELWAPSVRSGPAEEEVMRALCRHVLLEAERTGVPRVEVILEQGHARFGLARAGLLEAGFAEIEERVVVTRDLDDSLPPDEDAGLTWASPSDLVPAELRALGRAIGMEEDRLADVDPEAPETPLGRLGLRAGEAVAMALASSPPGGETFTLHHLGVVPAHRGRGRGRALLIRTLRHARDHGFVDYVGSTATANHAMRRVFEHLGCETVGKRLALAWPPSLDTTSQ